MRKLSDRFLRALTIERIAIGLAAVAGLAIVLSAATRVIGNWTPNIATEAISLLLTIVVVDRVVAHRRTEDERGRVEQALRRISGDFHVLADFVLWDYADMHQGDTYRRPPHDLRGLLTHFKDGLATREGPWPSLPRILTASKAISDRLDEQISRHERVLDHAFITAAYRYIRNERMSRNMYLDPREHHDEDGWKSSALSGLSDMLTTLLDAFQPYARRYLGDDWNVVQGDDEIDYTELLRGLRDGDDDAANEN
jgi:hypothetical protein